jgi:hypothetical protein
VRGFVEVYDHPKASSRAQDVPPVEAFAAADRSVLAVIWTRYSSDDRVNLVDEIRSPTRDVVTSAVVVHDLAAIWIRRPANGSSFTRQRRVKGRQARG